VDDGSEKEPATPSMLKNTNTCGYIISLSKNVGHQQAIAVAFDAIQPKILKAKKIVVMDADGEDDPAAVELLLRALEKNRYDVVAAKRGTRKEGWLFKLFYWLYKFLFLLLTGRTLNFGNFMALTDVALKKIARNPTSKIHLAGTVLASGLKVKAIEVNREKRFFGQSKMRITSLVRHGIAALTIFLPDILVRIALSSFFIFAVSIASGLIAIVLKITNNASPGWLTSVIGFLVVMIIQAFTVGIGAVMFLASQIRPNSNELQCLSYEVFEEVKRR
jgi:hypothetical protein